MGEHAGERTPRGRGAQSRSRPRGMVAGLRAMSRSDWKGLGVVALLLVGALLLLGSFVTVVVVGFPIGHAALEVRDDDRIRENGRVVTGVVTDIRETSHVGYTDYVEYVPWVRYETPTGEATTLMKKDSADEPGVFAVGQRVDVLLDPAKPDEPRLRRDDVRDEHRAALRTSIVVGVIALVVFVSLLVPALRWSKRQEARVQEHRERRAVERLAEREVERERERSASASARAAATSTGSGVVGRRAGPRPADPRLVHPFVLPQRSDPSGACSARTLHERVTSFERGSRPVPPRRRLFPTR